MVRNERWELTESAEAWVAARVGGAGTAAPSGAADACEARASPTSPIVKIILSLVEL